MAVRRRSVTGAEKEAVWAHEERRKGERKRRQETWRIWSAKCEEFSRVAFTVTSIDPADIYYEKGVGGGWTRCTFVAPRTAKVLSHGDTRRGASPRLTIRTRVVRPRLETRIHCKAFLMTEEILSYTHPFRTPRLQRERFVSGGVNLRIGVECRRRWLGGRGASLTALTTCHWR